jgi:putative transposase
MPLDLATTRISGVLLGYYMTGKAQRVAVFRKYTLNHRDVSILDGSIKSNRNITFSCKYHVVWCPKYRRPVLVPKVDVRLKQIISEVCAETDTDLLEMEIMPDHVHLLVECDPTFGINRLIRSIKGRSSRVLRTEFPHLRSRIPCLWTNSYFVSTVGGAPLAVIKQYIANQKHV